MKCRICIIFILISCAAQTLAAAKKYKIKLISIDRCKLPEDKYDKSEPVVYSYRVRQVNRHTSLVSANITVRKHTGPTLFNLKLYQLTKTNAKDLVFKQDKVDCHNPFTYQLFRAISVKMDTDCIAAPGFYRTADINLQDYSWILTKIMATPGRYIYSFEAYLVKTGILACSTMTCDIIEAK